MALTEDRVLISYEINVATGTVSILWHDRILRDGVVVGTPTSHRGAYELVNGDLPDHIKSEFHISMFNLGQSAVAGLTQVKAEVEAELVSKTAELAELQQLYITLQQQFIQANQQTLEALNENVS